MLCLFQADRHPSSCIKYKTTYYIHHSLSVKSRSRRFCPPVAATIIFWQTSSDGWALISSLKSCFFHFFTSYTLFFWVPTGEPWYRRLIFLIGQSEMFSFDLYNTQTCGNICQLGSFILVHLLEFMLEVKILNPHCICIYSRWKMLGLMKVIRSNTRTLS